MPVSVFDQLQESEANFRLLFEHSTSAVGVHEIVLNEAGQPVDYIFLSANPAFETQTGLRCADIIGRRVTEILPGIEKSNIIEVYGKVVQTGEPVSFEHYAEPLGRHFIISAYKVGDGRFATAFTDITERKQAENVLRDIISNNPMAIQIVDKEGYTLSVNPAHTKLFGSVPPSDFSIFSNVQLMQKGLGEIYQRLQNGEVVHFPDLDYNAHDSYPEYPDVPVCIRTLGFPLFDGNNKPERFVLVFENITERKQAENALGESEKRFRNLVDNQGEGVGIVDLDETFTFSNPAADKLFGLERGGLVGRSLLEFMDDEQLALVRAESMKRDQGVTSAYEMEIMLENGERRSLIVTGSPQYGEDGKRNGSFAVFRDITERKQMEEALRTSEERFSKLAEQSGTFTWEVDVEGLYTYMSPVSKSVLGYSPEEMVGRKYFYGLHPEAGREKFKQAALAVFERKEAFLNLPNAAQRKDGRQIWLSTNGIPILSADGTLQGYRGSDTDITEHKRAEEALQDQRRRLESIIEGTRVGTWEWNIQTGETVFNEFWAKTVGYTLKELEPISIKTWGALAHPDDLKQSGELLERHFKGELPCYDFECRIKHKDGRWVWVHDRGRVITRTADDKPLMMFGTHTDISERKLAEENKRLASDVLSRLNTLDETSNGIHDILSIIKERMGFEAVGIRLREGEDFPYHQTYGFPDSFVQMESILCARDETGAIVRDPQGNPLLECMCGNILCGRTNPALPFFTEEGSFWSNGTTDLLAATTKQDRQAHTRNRCNSAGYESVALIPLRSDNKIIGLLQLNDHRKNQFTPDMIRFFEELGNAIGIALARIHAEETLRTSEALLKSTLESTGDGILVVDNTGKVVNANKRFAELWRIPQPLLEEHDDQKLLDYVLDQLVDPQLFVSKVMLLYLSTEQDFDTLRFKDGRVFDRFSSPLIQNDQVVGRVWSFRDVTERRRAEQELRLTRFSIDRSGDAVYWINSEGSIVDANETACKALGYQREELIGLSVWDITEGFSKEMWPARWQRIKNEKCFVLECDRRRKDGSIVPTEVSANYIEFEGQELNCAFARDISDRKRNETMQSVLYEISEATGRSSTLLELLGIMQQQIGRLMDTENFYIALYDEETELYTFAFVRDNESVDPTTIPPQKLKRSLTDYIRRQGTAILLTQQDQQALFDAGEVELLGTISKLWMGIPLTLSDRVIGVVGIQTYTDDVLYTEQDKDLMSIIASSIALAIDRKRSEESIIRMRGAVESSGEVIFMTDRQGIFTYVNPEFTRLYSYTAAEVVGKHTPQLLKRGNDSLQNYEKILDELLRGHIVRSELVNYTKDDKSVIMDVSANPIYDEKNVISGTLAVQRDITLQKQAELELRDNEAKLEEAQRIAKVGSWEHWVETGVMKASDELHRIFALDPVRDKVTRAGEFPKLFHAEDRERVAGAMTNLVQNRIPIDIDFRIVLKDGTLKYIHEHAQIKKDSEGSDVIFGTAQDITEQKKAEEERKALETQLRRTQRLETIGTLAGGIAHDFNNILTPILGYADMAMISVPEEHPVREDLEHVIKAAHRAKELVQQILTFSRQGDQEKKPLEIHLIVKEVLELMRASLPSTIEIKQNVDPTCGRVLADPSQIHQVLMNLCTNAFHAMRDSGGTLEISLRVDSEFARVHPSMEEQPYVKLLVRDTGIGMSKSVMDRIFEPFFTTKGVGEGTGLGLSVVHGIITNHGGDITVESELGKGTTFSIYLPQAKHLPTEAPVNSRSLVGGNEHILLVDDEEEITKMVTRMLESLGYRITTRNSSVDALKLFSASPREFHLVICDQTMPDLTGSELASELLAIRPDLPVLMMTGYSESFGPDDARRLGIRQYLTKPLVAGDLNAAIRKQLGNPNLTEV